MKSLSIRTILTLATIAILIITSTAATIKNVENNDDDYAETNFFRYDDYIYDDSIKTVLLFNPASELSYPILSLTGNDKLKLSFDDLRRSNLSNFYYTIIHCDRSWEPSDLSQNEYIDGFFEDEIFEYKYSTNTDIAYTHYDIEFPNENLQISKSGNYILKVYNQGEEDKPIITRRFVVYENRLSVSLNIKRATDVNESYFRHEIDFEIDHRGYDIPYPFKNLQVVLMQNFRFDNAITNLKPIYIKDDKLIYDYNNSENVFDGINEFRNLELKNLLYQGIMVNTIKYSPIDKITHVYLLNDEARSYKKYYSSQDLNGNFLIKKDGAIDTDTDADYVKVHFNLPYPQPLPDGNLYLMGKFSDWKFREELKLDYDTLNLSYNKTVLLKQGYYNYMYCFVKDGSKNTGDFSTIEGSHYETENAYSVLVYHKELNDNYDRLVGFSTKTNRE